MSQSDFAFRALTAPASASDVPTQGLVVGAVIVVASGLYILWRETGRRRAPAAI